MLILDATNKSLQIKLSGAGVIPFTTHYADITTTAFTPASADGYTSGGTPVAIVAAPAGSTQRQVKAITVLNTTAGTLSVYIELVDNTAIYRMVGPAIAAGEMLQYIDTNGWNVMTSDGIIKMG